MTLFAALLFTLAIFAACATIAGSLLRYGERIVDALLMTEERKAVQIVVRPARPRVVNSTASARMLQPAVLHAA